MEFKIGVDLGYLDFRQFLGQHEVSVRVGCNQILFLVG